MKVCSITGCDRPHDARGWCSVHYGRWRHHGDPLHDPPPRRYHPLPTGCGEANPRWLGEAISYTGAHQRVRSTRADPGRCDECGDTRRRRHWAYDHARARVRVISTDPRDQGRPYSPDPCDYRRLCSSCHQLYDRAQVSTCG